MKENMEKLGEEIAIVAAEHADRHDREGSFVEEGVDAARELGFLAAPVPEELGGRGALTADMAHGLVAIGRGCGSTALASSMHVHVTLAAAWRWRRGDTSVEPLLRKIADGMVVASSGGNDWTHPSTVATPVEGGWRVSGRKTFCSLAPAADAVATFAVVGAPAEGAEVIAFGLPLRAEGVRIDPVWDAMGMRGTGSHDVVLDDVFVSSAQVTARRTWGELDRPLLVAAMHAMPVISAAYLGVAEGLAEVVAASPRATSRQRGLVDHHVRVARWALFGALDDIGPDPDPGEESFLAVEHAKLAVIDACEQLGPLALDMAGGGVFARPSSVARMVRDILAVRYHPIGREALLTRER